MRWKLFEGIPDDEVQRLLSSSRRRRFRRNEPVFHEGDPGDTLHLLASGHVAVRVTTPLGDVAALRILGPGDHFGELAIVSPAPRNATVVALDPVETLSLHRDEIHRMRAAHPVVDDVLTKALVNEIRRLSTQVLEAYYISVPKRVVARLCDLVDLFQRATEDQVEIPITQEEVAQLAGATRSSTNKALQDLQRRNLVRIDRGRLQVQDIQELRRFARR